MIKEDFCKVLQQNSELIDSIRKRAHEIHAHVNQHYAKVYEYGYHLDMVADFAKEFGHEACSNVEEIPAIMFGAYFHDSIEDARMTYNDVIEVASEYLDKKNAILAAEIAYALTNDKGRTRAERAGEKYYQGIRETRYAPFVKMCDRLANTSFSFRGTDESNIRMQKVYSKEYPHFIEMITSESQEIEYQVPQSMRDRMEEVMG